MKKSEDFLRKYNMFYEQTDFDELIDSNMKELKKARAAENSSISVIPSFLDLENIEHGVSKVIAVDAGGTNLRVALIDFDERLNPVVVGKERYGMPGKEKTITADEFFYELGEMISVYAETTDHIGISFAYKGEITEEKDYIIYKMCKEVDIQDIDGRSLAEGINSYFENKLNKKMKIAAVNDTAACLAGTVPMADLVNYGACIGMVLGTGFNVCYKEKMNRLKDFENNENYDIVITESGFFDKIKRGKIDEKIDNASLIPHDHYYEKMISGKYLPIIYNECMRQALADGYISSSEFIEEQGDGRFLNHLLQMQCSTHEAKFAFEICRAICRRSAMFAAANVIATVLMSIGDSKTAVIVPEGSTVLKMKFFMQDFEEYLNEYLTVKNSISYRLITAEDNVLKGAAKAVLM